MGRPADARSRHRQLDPGPVADLRRSLAGFVTVQFVAAVGFSLVAFVMLANFVVHLYARGAIRAAVDEGARAAAPVDGTTGDCERRARDVLDVLMGGVLRRGVTVGCVDDFGTVRAYADAVLPGWLPLVTPDWRFRLVGTVVKERDP